MLILRGNTYSLQEKLKQLIGQLLYTSIINYIHMANMTNELTLSNLNLTNQSDLSVKKHHHQNLKFPFLIYLVMICLN